MMSLLLPLLLLLMMMRPLLEARRSSYQRIETRVAEADTRPTTARPQQQQPLIAAASGLCLLETPEERPSLEAWRLIGP